MDFVVLKKRINEWTGKYKYVGIVLLVGIILMMIPSKNLDSDESGPDVNVPQSENVSIEERMEDILSCVEGAGQVKVMLSISKGESSVYQTDSSYSQSENNTDTRTQTIIVSDNNRNESGLVYQKNPPVYQGAIVLSEGAEDPQVKLAIVDAVMDVTGLGADRISVLKMK